MNKNQLQNTAIVLLLISSIVLLSIRFELFVSPSLKQPDKFDAVGVESILKASVRPTSIIIRYSTNNVTKLIDKEGFYYQEARSVLKDSLQDITGTEEITADEYLKLKDSKSIQLDFEPTLDQRLLYGSLFLEDGSFGEFKEIREILIPLVNDTSIYVKTPENKIYRLKNQIINYMPYVDNLSDVKYSKYYSLGDLFDATSEVLISDEAMNIPNHHTESAFNDDTIISVMRSVFSNRYDFANRISELDGTYITTYDYGRELLKISPDGKIMYSNSDALNNPSKVSMVNSLLIAYSFIDKFNLNNDTYVVEDVAEFEENGAKGFTFSLNPRIEGLRLCNRPLCPHTKVTVVNGRIYAFESISRVFNQNGNSIPTEQLSALEVLSKNFEYLEKTLKFENNIDLFNKISLIDIVYSYDNEMNYIPSYKMIIDNQIFYFDMSEGEVM